MARKTSQQIFEEYEKCEYIDSSNQATGDLLTYKYRSAINFVEFIDEVITKNINYSHKNESVTNGKGFSGTDTIQEAVTLFREAKFNSAQSKKSNHLIIKMRQGIKYTDAGDELSVPEFLGKSENYFIEHELRNRRKRLILKNPIIINFGCNANIKSEDMNRAALRIINKLYEHQVQVPKIIISYLSEDTCSRGDMKIFIDVPYFDFNSLIRFSFPSTFRRLIFRNMELLNGLGYGYGHNLEFPMATTLNEVIQLSNFTFMTDEEIDKKMDEIIAETIKINNVKR